MTSDPHATGSHVAIGPKPWRCERCGHASGLVELDGLIQCFTTPACERRRLGNATPDRAAIEWFRKLIEDAKRDAQQWGPNRATTTAYDYLLSHEVFRG